MITLKSDCLRVHIAEPGEHPNDGCRFDRAGFITEVVLNNERSFCANEPKNLSHPTTGGRGFCSEFQPTFDAEAAVGERYPKFGVGLIKKEADEPYAFYGKYDIEYFPVTYSCTDNEAVFETAPIPCKGYALKAWKKITVTGNEILTEHRVENVGEKALALRDYCHNFISVDGMAISPDYRIDFPNLRDFGCEELAGAGGYTDHCNMIGSGHGIGFKQAEVGVSMHDPDLTGMDTTLPFRWKVEHKGARAYVEGEDSYVPCKIVIWTTDHIISPENFNAITIAPGEAASWSRKLRFVDEMAE